MVSDTKNVEHFDAAANNPALWERRGLDLRTAADVLRDKATNGMMGPDWSNLSPNDAMIAGCLKYSGLLFQAAMLQGFAVECLLKCFWIVQGNSVAEDGEYKIGTIKRENHDLVKIAEAVGFAVSKDEAAAMAKLSLFARSLGRYPIAKKWQENPMVKNEFGIDAGLKWTEEDHLLAEVVLARLKSEITSGKPSVLGAGAT